MISIENLHFAYPKNRVFNGISSHMEPGHIYGILGKNGTGKSTLLHIISGLLFPTAGIVKVMGFAPVKRQPSFLRDIFMVPEEFHLPNISIADYIALNGPFYPKFSRQQFFDYVRGFGIPEHSTLQAMSYGQKKKVLISFGLATNVSLLLMDEPGNGLDIVSKSQLRKMIAGAVDQHKCVLISSHQVKDLENLIDEVLIIDDTRIILKQSLETIARKLSFKISFDPTDLDGALYSEPLLRGNTVVTPNTEGEESNIDLEILYKAAMADPEKLQAIVMD
jgi:ABC-2 type transport system ATP-binding protein